MDVVDNAHMERILNFVESEELKFDISVDKDKELPWFASIKTLGENRERLFLANGLTSSDVLKRVSMYVHRIQAERVEPTQETVPGVISPTSVAGKIERDYKLL